MFVPKLIFTGCVLVATPPRFAVVEWKLIMSRGVKYMYCISELFYTGGFFGLLVGDI